MAWKQLASQQISQILAETKEIEHHIHNKEIWIGANAVEDSLTDYQAISGNGAFGTELLILDVNDTPFVAGNKFFDFHRLGISASSSNTKYLVRIIWGSGTVGEAETARQYTTCEYKKLISTGQASGNPLNVICKRIPAGYKVWIKIKNATNLATLDFLVGIHEYEE